MRNKFPGFDWENIMHENPFGSKKPIDFNWLESIIHKSIDQTFSSKYDRENPVSNPSPNIKETEEHIFIQMQVPKQIEIEDIQIFLDTNKLKVTGIDSDPLTVNLPSNGTITGSEAIYNQHALKIKITKNKEINFQEIKINCSDQ